LEFVINEQVTTLFLVLSLQKESWYASISVMKALQLGMCHYRQTFRILSTTNKFVISGSKQVHQTTCEKPYYNGILYI
jgi:hypothetical protein